MYCLVYSFSYCFKRDLRNPRFLYVLVQVDAVAFFFDFFCSVRFLILMSSISLSSVEKLHIVIHLLTTSVSSSSDSSSFSISIASRSQWSLITSSSINFCMLSDLAIADD